VAKKIGIKREIVIAETYMPKLLKLVELAGTVIYKPVSKYPSLERDLAFVLDEGITYNSIKEEVENFHDYISRVELFDEYHGDKIGEFKKSLAFHVTYSAQKTLEAKEVDAIQKKLLQHFEQKFEAKIRDF
jgi:phenylalanyl-tRNA synthetase beta chain